MSSLRDVLRVELSESLEGDRLADVRRREDPEALEGSLAGLLRQAGVERLTPVYMVSEAEVREGSQFAREFKVFLTDGTDPADAMRTLESSQWVNAVRPLELSRGS